MNEKSIYNRFSDGTFAAVMRMSINDIYSGILEGTRTAYCKHYLIEEIHEKMAVIESSARKGQPNGKYTVEPEIFYASKEDIEQLTKVLASVAEKIDFSKYSERSINDVRKMVELCGDKSLLPSVSIIDCHHASLTYSYWSEFSGLFRETVPVELHKDKISFSKETTENLVRYDCGIRY